jgi:hypothetical protein
MKLTHSSNSCVLFFNCAGYCIYFAFCKEKIKSVVFQYNSLLDFTHRPQYRQV